VLIQKKDFKDFNKYIATFLVLILNQEKYKYSYGRVVTKYHVADWKLIELFIKSLPYSNIV